MYIYKIDGIKVNSVVPLRKHRPETRKKISQSLKKRKMWDRARPRLIVVLSTLCVLSWALAFDLYMQPNTLTYVAEAQETATSTVEVREVHPEDDNHWYVLIDKYAEKYNVSFDKMYNTIACESQYDPSVQSRHVYKDGTRERSFGLSQISVDHHDVTIAEAVDPEFAVKFMARKFAEGKHHLWTCARELGYAK